MSGISFGSLINGKEERNFTVVYFKMVSFALHMCTGHCTYDCLKYSVFLVRAKWLLWKQEPGWELMDVIPWYGTGMHLCCAYELRSSEAERNAQTKV